MQTETVGPILAFVNNQPRREYERMRLLELHRQDGSQLNYVVDYDHRGPADMRVAVFHTDATKLEPIEPALPIVFPGIVEAQPSVNWQPLALVFCLYGIVLAIIGIVIAFRMGLIY